MITGAHSILYASDAEAARAFFRDVLGLPHVDAGHGWLIFTSPPAELAVHPTGPADGGRTEMYLMCDDLASTIAELRAKGVGVADEVEEAGWGRVTRVTVPGAGEIGLYEPLHPTAYDLG
ncbi:VOC family protein [Nocardia cyriacigeorgica]|uniref:VOC family protein n=1 Tax=Nocardia cyriacigeorgica TaxID=135487 RepID=UPI0018948E7B|nr:VOC family protein [Nocardia cyriacigeorgica]MBF6160780.1 VOC family protein [Nocardia cyriacigeorgica]MBF6201636.1 VOC family protein [Nocardia cyriacigeorgica]MBF6344186.1 VOC family protein [Nocardia cyriacigeorgica]